MTGQEYGLWLGLLFSMCVAGWIAHRQFENAKRERLLIIKAIDFLEREMGRLRERLPLSGDEKEALRRITEIERPHRDPDFK